MTQPNPTIPVAVTQADREAAASYGRYRIYSGLGADGIAAGRADRDDLVQAFARHRLAHQPNPLAAEVKIARQREVQMLGAALSRRDWHATEAAYNQLRDRLDAALRALKGQSHG